tara:strand:- start:335 stop:691 length:357 start_codon:yes stop_codon:yes gene_type:complete
MTAKESLMFSKRLGLIGTLDLDIPCPICKGKLDFEQWDSDDGYDAEERTNRTDGGRDILAVCRGSFRCPTFEFGWMGWGIDEDHAKKIIRKALRVPEDDERIKQYQATQEFFEDTSCN